MIYNSKSDIRSVMLRLLASLLIIGSLRAQDVDPATGMLPMAPKVPESSALNEITLYRAVGLEWAESKILERVTDENSVNMSTEYGNTAVSEALRTKRPDLARTLISKGFKPALIYSTGTSFGEIGVPVLVGALKNGAEDIVQQMLVAGINPYKKGFRYHVKIAVLAQKNRTEIFRKFIQSADRESLEHDMVREGVEYLRAATSLEMIHLLLEAGANINQASGEYPISSPLQLYAQRGWTEGVVEALKLGADPTYVDKYRKPAEDYAKTEEIRKLILVAALNKRAKEADTEPEEFRPGPLRKKATFPVDLITVAINDGEIAAIESLRKNPIADLNGVESRGWDALMYAISSKNFELANELIDRGVNINKLTKKGASHLAMAAEKNSLPLVQKLLEKGANVNATDNGAPTPLFAAIRTKNLDLIEVLLKAHAEIDPPRPDDKETYWQNALMVACKTGDIQVMNRIFKAGADIQAVDSSGENIAFHAVRSKNVEALRWAVSNGAYAKSQNPKGFNALTLAAHNGDLPMVKALLEMGVTHPKLLQVAMNSTNNTNAVSTYLQKLANEKNPGDPALLWSGGVVSYDDTKKFLDAGGNPNFAEATPTPLQCVTGEGTIQTIQLLLEKGADPRKRGTYSSIPPFLAFLHEESEAIEILKLFFKHGITPNEQNFVFGLESKTAQGDTLLIAAVEKRYFKCVDYLLSVGADPRISGFRYDAYGTIQKSTGLEEHEIVRLRQLFDEAVKKLGGEPPHRGPNTPAVESIGTKSTKQL